MVDEVRHRHSIMSVALESISIHDYKYIRSDFELPTWLSVPDELVDSMNKLHQRARISIKSMRDIAEKRDKRYHALCPGELGLIYDLHTYSIKKLLDWKEQTDPTDPTLAPAAKIPRDCIKFTLDPQQYEKFTKWYHANVQNFMAGPYASYLMAKFQTTTLASQILDQHEYREWRHWWDGTFMLAMWKWEACLEGLVLPTWEEIIDDVFLMILDRVEDSDELAKSLCSSCSPPVTPQTHTMVDDYFDEL